MRPLEDSRERFAAGLEQAPRMAGIFIAAMTLMLVVLTLMFYLDAREVASGERTSSAVDVDPSLVLALLAGLAMTLRYRMFNAPKLDALLVTPLSDLQLFWTGFKQVLRPVLMAGAATLLPLWGHLLGAGVEGWLFAAATVLWLAGWTLLTATAGLLALAGWLACSAPLAVAFFWPIDVDAPFSGGFPAPPAGAAAWHPAVFWLPVVTVACALVLGLDHLLARRVYSRDALIALRDRPTPWWLRPSGPPAVESSSSAGFGAWLVQRMGTRAHGLWRLVQREETPEDFARRIPLAMILPALWLVAAHWRLGGLTPPPSEYVFFALALFVAWLVALALLGAPSSVLHAGGQTTAEKPGMVREPVQEIFPISARDFLMARVFSNAFLITASLLLLLPFVWLAPLPARWTLTGLLFWWLLAQLFLAPVMQAAAVRLDPRRPGFRWWLALAQVAGVLALAVASIWAYVSFLHENETFLRIVAVVFEWVQAHPTAAGLIAVAILAVIEVLAGVDWLRRDDKRWFDAAW